MVKSNKKILFIYKCSFDSNNGGARRSFQNFEGCKAWLNTISFLTKDITRPLTYTKNLYLNNSSGVCKKDTKKIIKLLMKNSFDAVFLDSSIYGTLALAIRNQFPRIKIIVNFHNFEYQYSMDLMKLEKNPFKKLIWKRSLSVNEKNEELALSVADYLIFISNQDKIAVENHYSKGNDNSYVIPPVLQDTYKPSNEPAKERYCVFFGSNFFANVDAVKLLIKIAPKVKYKILIFGRGLKRSFPLNYENVEIVNDDKQLNNYLNNALAFIAPTYFGSGASIKIADALMHGNYIISTKKALNGYDKDKIDCTICDDEDDFISAINSLKTDEIFNLNNRKIFERYYSMNNNAQYYEWLKGI